MSLTKDEAIAEAGHVARTEGIRMVVTFNPYSEQEDKARRYNYYPEAAAHIFSHEEIIETIEAGGQRA